MRLNCFFLPFLIFGLFGYGVSVLQRSADSTNTVTKPAVVKVVKHDAKVVKADVKKAIKTSKPDYTQTNK